MTSIGDARALGAGALVTIAGILTTDLGGLEAGRTAFVQDATGGIALWLDDASSTAWPAGSSIRATGTLDTRYGQRILRVATTDAVLLGAGLLPVPRAVTTGEAATEASEGWRLAASGTVVESCEALSDGTSTVIDDGSGPLRIVVTPAALASRTLSRGAFVHVRGPLGQRDSTGAGTAGYRLYVVLSEDLEIDAPTPSPTPEATPIGSGEPGPDPTASTPPEEQDEVAIEDARATAIGAEVRVAGTVVAEAPRLGSTQLIAIQDATAGIVVHLVNGGPTPVRGDWIHVTGTLAAPYGQLELRPAPGGLSIDGCASLPTALVVTAMDVGEGTEGRLVTMVGRRDGGVRREGDGGLSLNIRDAAGGSIRIMADASSRLSVAAFPAGRNLTITGIVGQRATATGRLDGYRIWVRDASDVIRAGADAATPAPSAARSPAATASPRQVTVAAAIAAASAVGTGGKEPTVQVEAAVTAPSGLLNDAGTQIVVADATGAILAVLPTGTPHRAVGTVLRLTGTAGRNLGAPRLLVRAVEPIDSAAAPPPVDLRRPPAAVDEWHLVRVSGRLVELHTLGDRWRAEMLVGGTRVPIVGLAGSGIAAPRSPVGRLAVVTGIVRRPNRRRPIDGMSWSRVRSPTWNSGPSCRAGRPWRRLLRGRRAGRLTSRQPAPLQSICATSPSTRAASFESAAS